MTPKGQRLFAIVGGIVLVLILGGSVISWLSDKCQELSQNNCYLMWGIGVAAIVGGIILAEVLIARRKSQGKWRVQLQDSSDCTGCLYHCVFWYSDWNVSFWFDPWNYE